MAESTIVKTLQDGTLKISDNAGANSYTISYESGDFSLDVPGIASQNFLDRGQFGSTPSVRNGDDQPMTGSFTFHQRDIGDATDVTTPEFFLNDLPAAWVGTLGANGEHLLLTLLWTIEGTNHGDGADHTITCNFCRITGSLSEGYPNTGSISFTSFDVYPTVT
jgi:hypothetical protein